ncbi:MAG: DUF1028 domain-containing protein [Rhodobacteraceae bacterium]|nr:DUF1028 domain-containing protein [Paracoccaceae bacterium]
MTYTILAIDEKTGRLGGAAATGSLCVGGWVLRGDPRAGMSASQGTAPSTLWGEQVLERMRAGSPAETAVAQTVDPDSGRAYRQLAALDPAGRTAAFTGEASVPACGHRAAPGVIVAGNMLQDEGVLDAALAAYLSTHGDFTDRLMAALFAGERAGSDSRGLLSAALLVVGRDIAPITLRVDYSETPLSALSELLVRTHTAPYSEWVRGVPTLDVPGRADV